MAGEADWIEKGKIDFLADLERVKKKFNNQGWPQCKKCNGEYFCLPEDGICGPCHEAMKPSEITQPLTRRYEQALDEMDLNSDDEEEQ